MISKSELEFNIIQLTKQCYVVVEAGSHEGTLEGVRCITVNPPFSLSTLCIMFLYIFFAWGYA